MKSNTISWMAALALGSLLACTTVSFAQDAAGQAGKAGRRGGNPQQRVERMASELNLTADQKTKLTALFEEQNKQMQEMRNLTPEERRPKAQAFREEQTKKMKEILTPEQFEKWQQMKQGMRQRQGGAGAEKKQGGKKAE